MGEFGIDADVAERIGGSTAEAIESILAEVDGPCTLVLDDLHLVPFPLQSGIAAILQGWYDDDRHLIVSTRDGLSRLSMHWPVHDATVIVQPRDLLLDGDSVAHVLGPDLADAADRVIHAIGGWARGIEVFRRHLVADPSGGFGRAEMVLQALVASEILPHLDDRDLELLSMVSLGDSVPTSVTERVWGGVGASSRLRSLADATAFVVVDDDDGRWFLSSVKRSSSGWQPASRASIAPTHLRFAQAWLDEPPAAEATEHGVCVTIHQAGPFERAVRYSSNVGARCTPPRASRCSPS